MATKELPDTKEIEQILAEVRPLYREFQQLSAAMAAFWPKLRGYETHICTLLNWEEGYSRRVKEMESRLAQTEQAAKTRLSSIEHGHKTLIDDLSRKQLEADKAKADAEALQRKCIEERAELAALKDYNERLKAELSAVAPAIKSKK